MQDDFINCCSVPIPVQLYGDAVNQGIMSESFVAVM